MNTVEKYGTMIVALIGAVTGGLSVHNDHSMSEFTKPISLREVTVKSYLAQISSAEKRSDMEEVLRIRLDYEQYEESWRIGQKLTALTAPFSQLVSFKITEKKSAELEGLLSNADIYVATGLADSITVASGYLATGDYTNATKYFEYAAIENPNNANLQALRSVAWAAKAEETIDTSEKLKLIGRSLGFAKVAAQYGIDESKIKALTIELKANKALKQSQ